MPIDAIDDDPKIAGYHDPSRLVTPAWVAERIGTPGLVIVESNEDPLLYDVGHLPGAGTAAALQHRIARNFRAIDQGGGNGWVDFAGKIVKAGYKFGRWLDLVFYQKLLDGPKQPVGE